MLGFGIATSHPAGMLRNKEDWTAALTRMMDPESPNTMPYTAKLELETPGVIDSYIERIRGSIGSLREMVRAYNPDAIIMIGDDQGEWFSDENSPTFAIYTGDEAFWGLAAVLGLGVYSMLHTFSYEAPVSVSPLAARVQPLPPRAPAMPYNGPLVTSSGNEPMVVHFACNQDDARWARIYDPPASGRSVILRLDQSPDQMRALYVGGETQFPRDTRIVTTPCTQALVDEGKFP